MAKPRVTKQSISFNGEKLNLSDLGRTLCLDHSYLSRIFSGTRNPSIHVAQRIARTLGMDLPEFLTAIESRRRTLHRLPKRLSA